MKQLLFLLLFPSLALAQYQGNGNQKITLGEQTTADGLVYRGIRADTTSKIVPFSDTSAYIILDTVEKTLWLYKAGQIPKWQQVGGSTLDTATMLLPYWRSGRFSGVLPVANGGTGSTTQNFVDLTTTQSVNGVKTFLDTIIVNKGIRFPATQAGSTNVNTLDDYEEGSWTPIYRGLAGSNGSLAYSVQRGRYTKVGRFVHASGEITLTNKGSWTSGVEIAGLPFATTAQEFTFGFIVLGLVDLAADVKYCQFVGTGAANNQAYIDTVKDNLDREILFTSAINNNSYFAFSFVYTSTN